MSKFFSADILLPDFSKVDGTKWATIACDQFTGEPEYWHAAERLVGDAPSALRLMIPEAFLNETEIRVPLVNGAMKEYLENVLVSYENAMIYIRRTQSDGRVRRGLVGMIDLEDYDYSAGSKSPIRATEGTVLSRIPPRVAVRRDAEIELPHVMMLVNDPDDTIFSGLDTALDVDYSFPLMLDGGSIDGRFLTKDEIATVQLAVDNLFDRTDPENPLLFAVGDGNHSLATAKAIYEKNKSELGDAASTHPSRYALVELVNIFDQAIDFEPIYRVVQNVSPEHLLNALESYIIHNSNPSLGYESQQIKAIFVDKELTVTVPHPHKKLTVATLQAFLDEYISENPCAEVDYIHGVDSLMALAQKDRSVGFLFDGITKDGFFEAILKDGVFPRKTFSMGHARDKRYYVECRRIK